LEISTFAVDKNTTAEPVTYCLQPLLAVEVLLNPSADTQLFVNQLLLLQQIKVCLLVNYLPTRLILIIYLQGYSNSRLYSELMRACLLCLRDVLGCNEESQWGAFTFLKLPQILLKLKATFKGKFYLSQISREILTKLYS
jgi:mediator of RNA polymerase II transcription subunit 24